MEHVMTDRLNETNRYREERSPAPPSRGNTSIALILGVIVALVLIAWLITSFNPASPTTSSIDTPKTSQPAETSEPAHAPVPVPSTPDPAPAR